MSIIYVLTEGDYSDYHIVGVYSTKELAEKAQFVYEYSSIEEYSLDNLPDYPPGMKAWCVHFDDGKLKCSYQANPIDCKIPNEFGYDDNETYIVYCWAVDKEHAEKIALDKYYQHQATKAGIV
tara:strand:+ start:161 stop:529 length:369 start_codon:yes stop_codon:yes gene_type:complete